MNLIEQEMSTERWIDIPQEIQAILKLWRPSPLTRAKRLEAALQTPAKIFYKNEGVSPAGSHKPNTAIAQAWYNKQFGIKHLITETGAGQWGSALAMSCKLIGIDCKVFMVRISFDQKPFRKIMMKTWGADCIASPSDQTAIGRRILGETPDTPGSLAIAISEAIEQAVERDDTRYALGSVLNHVMLHQTIIGLEARKQLEKVGLYPDIVIGCAGGGSNFAGISFPFICDKIHGREQLGLIDATAIGQTECYEAALLFAHTEGFIPAPETSHAIAQTIREARKAKEEGKEKVILMNWSGHGLMDLQGYDAFLSGKLHDYPLPEELLQKSLATVKDHPQAPQQP